MSQLLLKIQRLTFVLILLLFALSSNKHVLDFFVDSFKADISVAVENEIESENEMPEKAENEKKDGSEYYSFSFEFNFRNLISQQMESIHLENSKLHILIPSSPPPERRS